MTQKIVYLHRKDQNNPGDWWSSPHHYFPNYKGQVIDMLDNPEFIECDLLIVGGGGLFSTADWMKKLGSRNLEDKKSLCMYVSGKF